MDFTETWRSITGINKVKREPEKPLPKETQRILPESVRYSLQYGKGQLGIPEIISLAYDPYFKTAAMYLSLKWLEGNPKQFNLFSDIVGTITNKGDDKQKTLPGIIPPYLKEAKDTQSVDGKKLAQYSRQTPELFDKGFQKLAEDAYLKRSLPVLITNAGYLGLPALIKAAQENQQEFGVLDVSALTTQEKVAGYTVSYTNNDVNIKNSLMPAFLKATHVTLIDDSIHTEKTKEDIMRQLNKITTTVPVSFQAVTTTSRDTVV